MIKDVRTFNEDVMEVSVMKKEKDACEGARKTNIFIACFTAALARLKLYAELEKLGEQGPYYMTRTQSSTTGNKESRLYLQESFWVRWQINSMGTQLWSLDQLVQNRIAIKQ